MKIERIQGLVSAEAYEIFVQAWKTSEGLLTQVRPIVASSLEKSSLDLSQICIATVGSTARREAMNASDIDLLPIWSGDSKEFPQFEDLTGKVREDIRQQTGLDVSTSRNLMRSTQVSTLCRPDGIGGDDDHRRTLTQRMLILTESEQLGGSRPISEVRRSILEAYVGERDGIERTVSKHPMTVCNDIARYYRTLCVDYKSRAETKPESWAERHAKLRNARKVWYFSTVMAIARNVADAPQQSTSMLFDALEKTFELPPILRLQSAIDVDNVKYATEILNTFSQYLKDMGDKNFRKSLEAVVFENRNDEFISEDVRNPYYELHARSRKLSDNMIDMLLATSEGARNKVYNWFFL